MVTRSEWVQALRRYKGTPFLHQGRNEQGIDCIGLLMCAARDVGIEHDAWKIDDYRRAPDSKLFEKFISKYLTHKPCNRLLPLVPQLHVGDVLVFWIEHPEYARHVGVYTGTFDGQPRMIHAFAKTPRCVIEQMVTPAYWKPRLVSVWTLPQFSEQ